MILKPKKRFNTSFGFIDLLFNLLIGFVFLFVVSFMLINPVVTTTKLIDPKAEFMIIMTWPEKDTNDIDIWIRDDKNNFVSYVKTDNGYMHLDRDDLGQTNDIIIVDGKRHIDIYNQEVISIRQRLVGTYTINVFWYAKKPDSLSKVPVRVELIQINPYIKLAVHNVILETPLAEKGVFKFRIDEIGMVENIESHTELWVLPLVLKRLSSAVGP